MEIGFIKVVVYSINIKVRMYQVLIYMYNKKEGKTSIIYNTSGRLFLRVFSLVTISMSSFSSSG
jgi:hypothetical protein